jgi:hypothetical protein
MRPARFSIPFGGFNGYFQHKLEMMQIEELDRDAPAMGIREIMI